MAGSFVSDYVFNLSKKVLSQTEINVLEKYLGFSPTPSFIKKADKGSAVVIWDQNDYLKEAEKQLSNKSNYLETKVIEKDLVDLVEQGNKMFENLQRKSVIQEREKNYFKFNFKKATNLGKLYVLPKIHKGLSNIPGCPVISNCGIPTEVSEFLNHQLQPIMKQGN